MSYFYASKSERAKMDKKPHFRQSAVVFFMIGLMLLLIGLQMVIKHAFILYMLVINLVVLLVYAVVSSIAIELNEKKKNQ